MKSILDGRIFRMLQKFRLMMGGGAHHNKLLEALQFWNELLLLCAIEISKVPSKGAEDPSEHTDEPSVFLIELFLDLVTSCYPALHHFNGWVFVD